MITLSFDKEITRQKNLTGDFVLSAEASLSLSAVGITQLLTIFDHCSPCHIETKLGETLHYSYVCERFHLVLRVDDVPNLVPHSM